MANNIYKIFDEYSSEDYLCHRLKPRGELLCGYCNNPYEPEYNDYVEGNVCSKCGEVSSPYYED